MEVREGLAPIGAAEALAAGAALCPLWRLSRLLCVASWTRPGRLGCSRRLLRLERSESIETGDTVDAVENGASGDSGEGPLSPPTESERFKFSHITKEKACTSSI